MKHMSYLLFTLVLLQIVASYQIGGSAASILQLQSEIQQTIQKARANIWAQIQPNQRHWNNYVWLGTMFLSEYWFELKALNMTGQLDHFQTKFDVEFFKNKLLQQQLADGSWKQLVDENRKEGLLDATIFNYWFLKDIGVSEKQSYMIKAKQFVLAHGGLEAAQVMTQFKLAAFGQYDWSDVVYIPLFIFKSHFPFSFSYVKDYVGQWVYPHLIPLAYLRYHRAIFPVSNTCISELKLSQNKNCEKLIATTKAEINSKKALTPLDSSVEILMKQAFTVRGQSGSYGAYTISTLLNMLAFQHYGMTYGTQNAVYADYKNTMMQSLDYTEKLYFNPKAAYQGSLCDGRYWDTLLNVFSLLQSGENPQKVNHIVQNLVENAVQPNGGIPYGLDFQYAPDIDDTSILLSIYGKMQRYYRNKQNIERVSFYQKQIEKTSSWIMSNQNQDGGFPAFDKDKNDDQYKTIKFIFKLTGIDKSAEIFDPSCADIVGHILQSYGQCHLQYNQSKDSIEKSIEFLKSTKQDRMWSARWGINYVYAVGAAIPGLARVNYNLSQPWIIDVVKRLQQVQHQDGGFGQDSQSYNENKFINGVSTVTMTAWGLLALIQMRDVMDVQENILKATNYILNNFKENKGKFYDRSVLGTGHRGLLNLQYAAYAYTFPLVALSRVSKSLLKKQEIIELSQ